jgi:hypothetical protein
MEVPTKARRKKIYLFKNLQEMKGKMHRWLGVGAEAIGPNRRKLTYAIWMQFKREKMEGQVYSLFEKAWRRNQKWD